ncbi:MAG: sugar phosphate isomerase/epimerase [Kiritimatiellae bacterium]|nr:sugar phosphate isomerase/epimerase [Kiritimatiellia bacterium]
MNLTRRNFIGAMSAAGAACALPSLGALKPVGNVALQLYSIRGYISRREVGLAKALKDVAAIGYKGVEFAGYYGNNPKQLKAMLDDAGLVACGTHVGRGDFSPEKIKATCEFNLGYGNNLIICPGGGNFPGKGQKLDDFMKMLVEYYNKAAETAATFGCKVGLHNHTREFELKLSNGQTYWDYFFSNTSKNVCMEQDVGWTTCAGADPCEQYTKYPGRSPTLHAKENGMGKGVKKFDAILGQPGQPGAKGVEWDRLFKATDKDGVKWYVVECERHAGSLAAVKPSFEFLKSKGRG